MTTAIPGPRRRVRLGRIWPPVAFGVLALLLWELLVAVSGIPAFLLPRPSAIAAQVVAGFPTILSTAAVTGGNALVGLVAGFVAGVGLALLAARSRIVSELATPLVSAAAAVPIVALAPVFTTM
ncbi:MAG: ABC transporter permease, partial [Gammaproteobacteria bacterium]